MNHLEQRIAALSPEKLALLERRIKGRSVSLSALPVAQGKDDSQSKDDSQGKDAKSSALSFAQARLWFLDQLEPDTAVYNIPAAVTLPGKLSLEAFKRSVNEIVRRHEALRTTFVTVNGEPQQVVAPALRVEVPVIDLRELGEAERQAEVGRRSAAEARRPFDLRRGPLMRATLLRVSEEQQVLLLTMHHIISDGWSVGVFFRELSALYEAAYQGRPSPLAELPIQYADYAQWQRGRLSGAALAELLGYWREQLAGAPGVLELATDRVRPALQSFRGATQTFRLEEELTQGLRELSQRQGVTLFMTLLAGFKVLLYRYTGQEDIVVGTPIAGRNRGEIEGLIGFFINSLVLRTKLGGNPKFLAVLKRVREVTLGAYDHQDLPFERLVEELQPERSMSHAPLFQVVFSLQNAPTMANSDAPAATADTSDSTPQADTSTSKFDLTVSTAEVGKNLLGAFEYNTDLFEAATIERMVGHYRRLLEAVVADPEQRLSDISLIEESETRGYSLSDFPDAELSQKDFETLIYKISGVAVQE